MSCIKSLLPRFLSRPGVYKACSSWKKHCLLEFAKISTKSEPISIFVVLAHGQNFPMIKIKHLLVFLPTLSERHPWDLFNPNCLLSNSIWGVFVSSAFQNSGNIMASPLYKIFESGQYVAYKDFADFRNLLRHQICVKNASKIQKYL